MYGIIVYLKVTWLPGFRGRLEDTENWLIVLTIGDAAKEFQVNY